MTRKDVVEAASKHGPMVTAIGCLAMAVVVLADRSSASSQTDPAAAESAQMATLGTKLDAMIVMQEKQYERLGKIEEKIDPLGNRVTALEARVGGLERVWSSKAEDRP